MLKRIKSLIPDGPVKDRLLTTYRRYFGAGRRREIAMSYYYDKMRSIKEWASRDSEVSNFYYDITDLNREHLAHLVAAVTRHPYEKVFAYCEELTADTDLRAHIETAMRGTGYSEDIRFAYGRRMGWYAFARAMKPALVVETGVDHGIGACVLTSALLRNASEGHPGRYFGTELRSEAGKLLSGRYATVGEILYGDSIESLRNMSGPIDLFINDSDHSGDYEYQEYATVRGKLSPLGVILGDNSHVTNSLSQFSREAGRTFYFFSEKPKDHWYPGGGIGVSVPAST